MSILNKIPEPPFKGDKYPVALHYLDVLFPYFDDYRKIELSSIIRQSSLKDAEQKSALYVQSEIEILLYQKFAYAHKTSPNEYYGSLTPLGRKVKAAGGHAAFERLQIDEKARENERQRLADEKAKYDLKNAKRIYRTYWWTFTIAILGFLLAVAGLLLNTIFKH